jgi:nitrate/nitrite-specific signal transduction histidine kinase
VQRGEFRLAELDASDREETVHNFQCETGICADFQSDRETEALPPRVAREVAQIVHEALANVRKHSGAHHVHIRLGVDEDSWKLVIEDDGRGFEFSGRLTLTELDAGHRGSRVIRERVHTLKGQLAIESQPGLGSRLEILLLLSLTHSYVHLLRMLIADNHRTVFRDRSNTVVLQSSLGSTGRSLGGVQADVSSSRFRRELS